MDRNICLVKQIILHAVFYKRKGFQDIRSSGLAFQGQVFIRGHHARYRKWFHKTFWKRTDIPNSCLLQISGKYLETHDSQCHTHEEIVWNG